MIPRMLAIGALVSQVLTLCEDSRPDDALALLDSALADLPDAPTELTDCRTVAAWRVAVRSGQTAQGLAESMAALERLVRAGHESRLDWLCASIGFALALAGDLETAVRYADRAIAGARARGDAQSLRTMRAGKGNVLAAAGLRRQAIEIYDDCLAEPSDNPRSQAVLLNNAAYCHTALTRLAGPDAGAQEPHVARAFTLAREAIAVLGPDAGADWRLAWAYNNLGAALTLMGRCEEAGQALAAVPALAGGQSRVLQALAVHRARLAAACGRFDEGRQRLAEAEALLAGQAFDPTFEDLLDCQLTLEICAGARDAALAAAARRFAWQQERHRRQIDTVRELVAAFGRLEAQHRAEREHSEQQLLFWRDAALRDALCGTLNRRGLQAAITRLQGAALAVIALDLDHFKAINDRHGHAVGDQVLARTARCVQETLRQGDLLARLGGEEFCVVLEGCPAAEARSVAAKLCAAVAGQAWEELAPGLAVTLSCGVSAGTGGLDALLAVADQQLYRAKADGRNCVR